MPELDLQVEIDRLAIQNFVKTFAADMFQVVSLDKDNQSIVSSESSESNDSKAEEVLEHVSSPKQSKKQINQQPKSAVSSKTSLSSKSQIKKKIK